MSELRHASAHAKIAAFGAVKARLDASYASILADADAAPTKLAELNILVSRLAKLEMAQSPFHPEVADLVKLVATFNCNPTVRESTVDHWCQEMRSKIHQGIRRCTAAMTFGAVLAEHAAVMAARDASSSSAAADIGDGSEDVDADDAKAAAPTATDAETNATPMSVAEYRTRTEATDISVQTEETKAWLIRETLVPTTATTAAYPTSTDSAEFLKFLTKDVFATPGLPEGCPDPMSTWQTRVANSVRNYAQLLKTDKISTYEVEQAIAGLAARDLLTPSRRAELRAIADDDVLHEEIGVVLNMMLADLDTWSWETGATYSGRGAHAASVRVDLRRDMTGKMRAFLHEDLMTAVFLQWVGVKWATFFRSELEALRNNPQLWNTTATVRDHAAAVFVSGGKNPGVAQATGAIHARRRELAKKYALRILPKDFEAQASRARRYADDGDSDDEDDKEETPMELKQGLIHWIGAEAWLHKCTQPENTPFTALRTDVANFGPSIEHDKMLAVLKYLGMPADWRRMMATYMATPVRFSDAADATTYVTRTGLPNAHELTHLLAELYMFPLDFMVERVSGARMVRMHDDIWMWAPGTAAVQAAWGAVQTYMDAAGLALNKGKTGSVVLYADNDGTDNNTGLPGGSVSWGGLTLTPAGRWQVDQTPHLGLVADCRARLAAAPSVIAWVSAYNRFARFFMRSFGSAAHISGSKHITDVRDALNVVHKLVFAEYNGSAVRALAARVARVPDSALANPESINDGWMHWPVVQGGLELFDPFLELATLETTLAANTRSEFAWKGQLPLVFSTLLPNQYKRDKHDFDEAEEKRYKGLSAGFTEIGTTVNDWGTTSTRRAPLDPIDELVRLCGRRMTISRDDIIPIEDAAAEAKPKFIPRYRFADYPTWLARHALRDTSALSEYNHLLLIVAPGKPPVKALRVELSDRLSSSSDSEDQTNWSPNASNGSKMTPYWAYVVYVHADAMLAEFGTLRYLPSQVVPRSLVRALKSEGVQWN